MVVYKVSLTTTITVSTNRVKVIGIELHTIYYGGRPMVLAQIQIYQQDTMGESQSYKHSFIRLLVPVVGEEWSHSGLWMTSPLLHIRNQPPPPFFFFTLWSPRCRQPSKVC